MGFLNYGSEQEVFDKLHELTLAANKTAQELLAVVQQFHSGKFQDMNGLMLKTDEAIDVVGLDDVGAELCSHSGGECHVAGVPLHFFSDCGYCNDREAVALCVVDDLGEAENGVALVLGTDHY